MTSKWVGDALGKDGIYTVWIAMRRYPWLPPANYRDSGESAASLMKPLSRVVVIEDAVTTVGELQDLLKTHDFRGFPIIDSHTEFEGYATKQELITALGENFYSHMHFSLQLNISITIKNVSNSIKVEWILPKNARSRQKIVCECRPMNEWTCRMLLKIQSSSCGKRSPKNLW